MTPTSYRIRFSDGKHVAVHIHGSWEEYTRALRGATEAELDGSHACFEAVPVRWYNKRVGVIHLIEGRYGAGTVAHECLHAVFHWAAGKAEEDDWLEMICAELGSLVAEFWLQAGGKKVEL